MVVGLPLGVQDRGVLLRPYCVALFAVPVPPNFLSRLRNSTSCSIQPCKSTRGTSLPLIGLAIWMSIRDVNGVYMANSAWLICSEAGAEPTLRCGGVQFQPFMTDAVEQIGTCSRLLQGTSPFGCRQHGWRSMGDCLGLPTHHPRCPVFHSLIDEDRRKPLAEEESRHLTSRSLYIGFLGKVSGTMLYFITLMVIIPLLNDGSMATFAAFDPVEVRRRRLLALTGSSTWFGHSRIA